MKKPKKWKVNWFIRRMTEEDVKHAKQSGNKEAKIGDELWRVAKSVGPISIDNDHLAGGHLNSDPCFVEDIASIPVMKFELDRLRKHNAVMSRQLKNARADL